jgi:hypothetical protein
MVAQSLPDTVRNIRDVDASSCSSRSCSSGSTNSQASSVWGSRRHGVRIENRWDSEAPNHSDISPTAVSPRRERRVENRFDSLAPIDSDISPMAGSPRRQWMAKNRWESSPNLNDNRTSLRQPRRSKSISPRTQIRNVDRHEAEEKLDLPSSPHSQPCNADKKSQSFPPTRPKARSVRDTPQGSGDLTAALRMRDVFKPTLPYPYS